MRFSKIALCLSLLFTFFSSCKTRSYLQTKSQDAIEVFGFKDGQTIEALNAQDIDAFSFASFGKIPTLLGILNKMDTSDPEVHLINTSIEDFQPENAKRISQYGSHAVYAKKANWVDSDYVFLRYLIGQKRILFPFTVHFFKDKPLQMEGQSYAWAFQVRRYKFIDPAKTFSAAIQKAMTTVGAKLFPDLGPGLLIVYDDASDKRPNAQGGQGEVDTQHISQLGIKMITELNLLKRLEAELVSILNPGVAFGELVLISKANSSSVVQKLSHDEDGFPVEPEDDTLALDLTSQLTPRHIGVFEDVPERVPPLGGILTLEAQTPLSHVNLVAVNRKTPNVSTVMGLESIPGYTPALLGKLVKFTADLKLGARLELADPEEAAAHFARPKKSITVPPPILRGTLSLVDLATALDNETTASHVGAKASNYGKLQRLIADPTLVAPGYATGFDLYTEVVTQSGIQKRFIEPFLENKHNMTAGEINKALLTIRREIQAAVMGTLLNEKKQDILKAFTSEIFALLKGPYADVKRIRLRSSTNSEDLPQFNGAGLYESVGFNRSKSEGVLRNKLGIVLSSLWLSRAYWERDFFGIDHKNVALGIQINPAFQEESGNGVLIYSLENGKEVYWINAQFGSTPVTNPEGGHLPESFWVSEDLTAPRIQSHSGLGEVFLKDKGLRTDRTVYLQTLLKASQRISQKMIEDQLQKDPTNEYGVDIEFKLVPDNKNGELRVILKQARLLFKGKSKKENR